MRDNSWIVGQPYLNLTGLRKGCRLSGRKHISGLATTRPCGPRDRRVTVVTRSGQQTSHDATSGQSPGRRTRQSAVAQDYLRVGDSREVTRVRSGKPAAPLPRSCRWSTVDTALRIYQQLFAVSASLS